MRVLIVGCGYVGTSLGAELVARGHEVFGARRSAVGDDALKALGIIPVRADVNQPETFARFPDAIDWLINTVASSGGDEAAYRRVYLEGTKHLIERCGSSPPRGFIYTSSTGVYPQNDGSRVTEESVAEPDSSTSRVLVETERLLLNAAQTGFPAMILRCAGIYGPGRGYWLKQFLAGEARMDGNGERWLNMIHRDDIAGAVIAAMERGRPGEIYNVVDDEPVQQRTVFSWLAQKLNRPMPTSGGDDFAPRGRPATNKQVSNRKLRLALQCELKYPTFREGYAAELARLGVKG